MRNIAFVIWIICWPLAYDIQKYLDFLQTGKIFVASDAHVGVLAIIWVVIAILLYETKNKK
jgi:hypothetical protein